jgi:hypothetical protein
LKTSETLSVLFAVHSADATVFMFIERSCEGIVVIVVYVTYRPKPKISCCCKSVEPNSPSLLQSFVVRDLVCCSAYDFRVMMVMMIDDVEESENGRSR